MKTPEHIIAAFEAASERFLSLRRSQRIQGEPLQFIIEAQIRLKQAEYFLRRFRELGLPQGNGSTMASAGGGLSTQIHGEADVLRAHGEAFYYFAFRARDALTSIVGFDLSFDPIGVRPVLETR